MEPARAAQIVLSVCPGIDVWSRAFEEEGFFVVRAGDPILGQRGIEDCHPPAGRFDGVICGIPCQPFSKARNGRSTPPSQPDLTAQFERLVEEARPRWFVTENVEFAPIPKPRGYTVDARLLYAWWFGVRQRRKRRFTIGALELPVLLWPDGERPDDPLPTVARGGFWCSRALGTPGSMWPNERRRTTPLSEVLEAFGLPPDWDAPALRRQALRLALANAVPVPVSRALAQMIHRSF